MKIILPSRHSRTGSVLVLTLVLCGIVGMLLAYSMNQLKSQTLVAARSQAWNAGIGLAEAGVEEAIAHLQLNYTNRTSQGWSNASGAVRLQRNFGADYFQVTIVSNASVGPRFTNQVTSAGCMYLPQTGGFLCRTVAVDLVAIVGKPITMLARDGVSMNGNKAIIDSYDSSDTNKSTGGAYDPAKRQANAMIGCVNGNFNLGNGDIYGKIVYGSGVLSISAGPNCQVGNLAWINGNNNGIQTGASIGDSSMAAPDPTAPFASAPQPPPLTLGSTNYSAVLDDGNYMTNSLSGKVLVRGNAVLYVTGNVTITGNNYLEMVPGARLELYGGGASVNIGKVKMTPGKQTFLAVHALPSVSSVSVDNGPGYPCFINAPNVNFGLQGNAEFYGAVVCKTYSSGGNPAFHFDEAMGAMMATRRWEIASWAEQ